MDGLSALIGAGLVAIINISFLAFGYGKLTQKVDDLCRRVSIMENHLGVGKEK